MLKGQVPQVKKILSSFSYPYNRRIAGPHGHFTMENYREWLKKAERNDLAWALTFNTTKPIKSLPLLETLTNMNFDMGAKFSSNFSALFSALRGMVLLKTYQYCPTE